jgi:hypothetical protein
MKRFALILALLAFLCAPIVHPQPVRCSSCCDDCYTDSLRAFNLCRDNGGCGSDEYCTACVGEMISARYDCYNSQCPSDNCGLE